MSLREALAGGGGLKSVQTGYIDTTTISTAAGEDTRYVDVTISAVVVAKCLAPRFDGYTLSSNIQPGTCRLLNSTTLRISGRGPLATPTQFTGRWSVTEYK